MIKWAFVAGLAAGAYGIYYLFTKAGSPATPQLQPSEIYGNAMRQAACEAARVIEPLKSATGIAFIGSTVGMVQQRLNSICQGKTEPTQTEAAALNSIATQKDADPIQVLQKLTKAVTGQSGLGCWWCA